MKYNKINRRLSGMMINSQYLFTPNMSANAFLETKLDYSPKCFLNIYSVPHELLTQ